MRVEIQLRIVGDDGTVLSDEAVLRLDAPGVAAQAMIPPPRHTSPR